MVNKLATIEKYVPKVFDLFAGCGGLSIGLEKSGMNICWANENWSPATQTYRESHPNTQLFDKDVRELFQLLIDKDARLPGKGDVDLLVGGPPCQGFSGYNRYRSAKDPRNSLVEVFLDYIDLLQPRYVLFENVPGILSINKGQIVNTFLGVLESFGYKFILGILQAGYYGLPQNRWRVFVIAAQKKLQLPVFPEPTHYFQRTTIFGASSFKYAVVKPPTSSHLFWEPKPKTTVGDAISDLPGIDNGGGEEKAVYAKPPQSPYQQSLRNQDDFVWNHVCKNLGPIMFKRIKAIPQKAGAGWLDLPDDLKPRNLSKHGDCRYDNRFGRLHEEGTFNTILTEAHPYWSRVIHPKQDRVISVRESARAQGFPDFVHFFGKLNEQYKQIGNAVPPPLAEAIGKEIIKAMNGKL